MAGIIRLDGDVANANASTLHQTASELPDPATVRLVEGNRTEVAAELLTVRFEDASGVLADKVQGLRELVAANADALSHAVQSLLDTDQMNADAAAKAQSLIDDIVAAPAATTPSAPSSSASRAQGAFRAN